MPRASPSSLATLLACQAWTPEGSASIADSLSKHTLETLVNSSAQASLDAWPAGSNNRHESEICASIQLRGCQVSFPDTVPTVYPSPNVSDSLH